MQVKIFGFVVERLFAASPERPSLPRALKGSWRFPIDATPVALGPKEQTKGTEVKLTESELAPQRSLGPSGFHLIFGGAFLGFLFIFFLAAGEAPAYGAVRGTRHV